MFPIIPVERTILSLDVIGLTINLSKSWICLKQSGPHGAPSDNIMSSPVTCGFPEGI